MFYLKTIKELRQRIEALEASKKPAIEKAAKYSVGKIVDAVMVDKKPRNVKIIARDAKRIGYSVKTHSATTYMIGQVNNGGKYERVGHGVYRMKQR